MNYWLECWKKYAVFSGRARRKEYWMFALFNFMIAFLLGFVLARIAGQQISGVANGVYSLVALLPGLGVTVRRLHDTGRSGWWVLFALVPIIGAITLFVFMCLDSKPGANEYGPNPKGALLGR